MPAVNFKQLMCRHALRRNNANCTYECQCGLTIRDADLAALPKSLYQQLTTWMAYHFEPDDK